MRDLAETRQIAFADIGGSASREGCQHIFDLVIDLTRAAGDLAEFTGPDAFAVARNRGRKEGRAALAETLANIGGLIDADGRTIDKDRRNIAARQHTIRSKVNLFDVRPGRNHGEQIIHSSKVCGGVDQRGSRLGQWFGLGACAVSKY